MSLPTHTAGWVLNSQNGIDSLEFVQDLPVPTIGEDEILVRLYAASLNYRELAIAKGGAGPLGKLNLVPGSDGAGIVQSVGSNLKAFKAGDRVCTHLTCKLPDDETPGWTNIVAGLGHTADGTLRQFGVFHESSLVQMPTNLDFLQAATLTCSGLTAWNALFGLESKVPKPGDTVLVQGTGGVSIAALQFALAVGATVIATTSSNKKATRLKNLGAHHVINYRETPSWGQKAKRLSTDSKGCHIVVDVGGNSTLRQSLLAVRRDGVVAATGLLGDAPDGKDPTILDCIFATCIARGILLGTRKQFEEMNRFIQKHDIKPILDQRECDLASVKEAYAFMEEQKHFSKIGIRVS